MRVTIWSLYWPKSLSAVSMMAQIPNHITKRKSTPRPQYNTLLPRDFRWIVTPLNTPFTSQGYVRVVPAIGGVAGVRGPGVGTYLFRLLYYSMFLTHRPRNYHL